MNDTSTTFAKLPRRRLDDLAGARGVVIGAAEASPYELVTSRDFHRDGAAAVLSRLPEGGDVIVSIDCDGIDPSVLAAVPGGLTYEDMMAILEGVATRGRLAGLVLAELVPERDDPYKLSTLTAAHGGCCTRPYRSSVHEQNLGREQRFREDFVSFW